VTAAITAHELTRAFDSGLALDHLSFELHGGEVLALLGPNGAGKTTTVRILNGVLAADSGQARVLGFDPATQGDDVRRRTGVLTENAGLDDRLTTRENLEFTARLRGLSTRDARVRVDEMLERFGMAERADDLTQGFSTGQRKRVALARALLHDPQVLFLDEPTSGLDPAGTRDVIDLVQSLAGEGRTIVLATHFLGEAGRLADRMAVLHRGRLRAFGRPEELAADLWEGMEATVDLGGPASAELLATLGGIGGVLEGTVDDAGIRLRVVDREVVPRVVATIVGQGVSVYGAQAHPPSLEDVYFEIESRIIADEGGVTDGFRFTGDDPGPGRAGGGPTEDEAPAPDATGARR
jgi:ABC-2 type transport system ATP-binding protein